MPLDSHRYELEHFEAELSLTMLGLEIQSHKDLVGSARPG
jgi:hypothetical protein